MCIITRSKVNSANTRKTKTDSLSDFLVKFVEENVPSSIHGLHACIDEGKAEPTQFSLQVFFASIGGMSQLSHAKAEMCHGCQ